MSFHILLNYYNKNFFKNQISGKAFEIFSFSTLYRYYNKNFYKNQKKCGNPTKDSQTSFKAPNNLLSADDWSGIQSFPIGRRRGHHFPPILLG